MPNHVSVPKHRNAAVQLRAVTDNCPRLDSCPAPVQQWTPAQVRRTVNSMWQPVSTIPHARKPNGIIPPHIKAALNRNRTPCPLPRPSLRPLGELRKL